jgi:hypothetical protein
VLWPSIPLVASLPVLALSLGTALAHMVRADATMAQLGPEFPVFVPVIPVPGPVVAGQVVDHGPVNSEAADQTLRLLLRNRNPATPRSRRNRWQLPGGAYHGGVRRP